MQCSKFYRNCKGVSPFIILAESLNFSERFVAMPKALLISPAPKGLVAKGTRKFHRRFPPLSLLISAEMLRRQGFYVQFIDLNANHRQSVSGLMKETREKAKNADLVVMTTNPYPDWQCPSYEIASVLEFARSLPSERLVITGSHGSLYPGAMLRETAALAVVRDEPEQTVLETAQLLLKKGDFSQVQGLSYRDGNRICHNPARKLCSMDEFPPPAYDLANLRDYHYELLGGNFALLETSRGCPYSCTFCNRSMFQNRYRRRTGEQILQETDTLIQVHGCRSLYIFDLEFTLNREMVRTISRHLIEKNYAERLGFCWTCQTRADSVDADLLKLMKQSGCSLIHFGIEAGNAEILANTHKKISKDAIRKGVEAAKQAGIQTAGFFMFGLPGETAVHYQQTLDFALELNPTFASFHPLIPIPGSPLFEEAFGKGPYWDEAFPTNRSYFKPEQEREISRFVRKAYLTYYLRPRYVAERIFSGNQADYMRQFKLFLSFVLQK